MILFLALLCLLPLVSWATTPQLRRHEPEGIHMGGIYITYNGGDGGYATILFYMDDFLNNLVTNGNNHSIAACSFSISGVNNTQTAKNGKPILVVPAWPTGNHLACSNPTYTTEFVSLGNNFQLILYHNVLYNDTGNTTTLRVGVTSLPNVSTWSVTPSSNSVLQTVVYAVDVIERLGIAALPAESYPDILQ